MVFTIICFFTISGKDMSLMINSFLAKGFKVVSNYFATIIYVRANLINYWSQFEVLNINIFNLIKFLCFSSCEVRFNIIWNNCKIQSLFNNKDKVHHLSCVIYKYVCSCGANYIGETIRNVKIRLNHNKK